MWFIISNISMCSISMWSKTVYVLCIFIVKRYVHSYVVKSVPALFQ
jgi:hypothetical protein